MRRFPRAALGLGFSGSGLREENDDGVPGIARQQASVGSSGHSDADFRETGVSHRACAFQNVPRPEGLLFGIRLFVARSKSIIKYIRLAYIRNG